MKRLFALMAALVLSASFMTGCGKDATAPTGVDALATVSSEQCPFTPGGFGAPVTLWAGQNINAGTVSLSIQGDNLVVTYNTINGWGLYEAHLAVATSLDGIPRNKSGNPQIGLFPYKATNLNGVTSYSFTVSLTALGVCCDDQLVVAAHAVVGKQTASGGFETQTGWAEGTRFVTKGSWAMYFQTAGLPCTPVEPPTPPTITCETAFAFSGNQDNCFLNYGFSRWGWVIPTTVGTRTYDVYAGAGQCDLGKGTLVGTVTVSYNGSQVTVTYNMLSGYTMDEAHVYAGSAMFPVGNNGAPTVAPGQYTVVADLDNATSATYTVSGLSGNIYVIVHGVVCGDYSN